MFHLRSRLAFTIKELGDFTRTVRDTPPGERAYVDGPYGSFSVDRHPAPGYVFVAGGIGIEPMMGMMRALADRGDRRPLLLIHAGGRLEHMTFREAIEELKGRLDLCVVPVLEEPPEGWTGEVGRMDATLLARHLPEDHRARQNLACGPVPMIEAVARGLGDVGVPMSRCNTELFDLV